MCIYNWISGVMLRISNIVFFVVIITNKRMPQADCEPGVLSVFVTIGLLQFLVLQEMILH